jgi:hypothetical protein
VSSPDALVLGRPCPAEIVNPEASRLGPDPEPIGVRADALALQAGRHRHSSRMSECPLARALGRHSPCTERACIYYGLPDVSKHGCAVQEWAPAVARQPALAEWFLARRRESALAEEAGSPALLSTHVLATPGPGDD